MQLGAAARANVARDPFVIVGADGEPLAADTYRAPVQSRVVTNLCSASASTQIFVERDLSLSCYSRPATTSPASPGLVS
ncbi:MAG: hypothetical protein IPI35_36080 [Deltaproteobacteria bacterium]|nr:hypothetical protein [Deltaproteobacteria bacterium]